MSNPRFKCAKCRGLGKIDKFEKMDDGKCYDCDGKCLHRLTPANQDLIVNLPSEIRKKANWILEATAEDVGRMSRRQLRAANEFCKGSVPGFPYLAPIWEEIGLDRLKAVEDAEMKEWQASGGW